MTAHRNTSPSYTLIHANESHAPAIHSLEAACFMVANSPNTPLQQLTDSHSWSLPNILAELRTPHSRTTLYRNSDSNSYTGYIVQRTLLDETEILRLGVTTSARGEGVATALLRHVIRHALQHTSQHALQHTSHKIFLEVSNQNTTAVQFYNKCGFIVANTRKKYYNNSDAFIMTFKHNSTEAQQLLVSQYL